MIEGSQVVDSKRKRPGKQVRVVLGSSKSVLLLNGSSATDKNTSAWDFGDSPTTHGSKGKHEDACAAGRELTTGHFDGLKVLLRRRRSKGGIR